MFRSLFNRFWAKHKAMPSRTRQIGTVRQGKRYKANVNLGWGESLVATNEMIKEKLIQAGFTEVKVTGSGSTRKAEGLWPGPDKSGEIDPHLSDVTEIA